MYRLSRKAAHAAPSGPVTISRSPGSAKRGHGQEEGVGPSRVPTDDGHAGLGHPLVELEQIVDDGVRRSSERDHEARRLSARGGEVAEIHSRSAEAEIPKRDPVETEVHALDERVLRDD